MLKVSFWSFLSKNGTTEDCMSATIELTCATLLFLSFVFVHAQIWIYRGVPFLTDKTIFDTKVSWLMLFYILKIEVEKPLSAFWQSALVMQITRDLHLFVPVDFAEQCLTFFFHKLD